MDALLRAATTPGMSGRWEELWERERKTRWQRHEEKGPEVGPWIIASYKLQVLSRSLAASFYLAWKKNKAHVSWGSTAMSRRAARSKNVSHSFEHLRLCKLFWQGPSGSVNIMSKEQVVVGVVTNPKPSPHPRFGTQLIFFHFVCGWQL